MHSDEDKIKTDINYCVKIIQSGKLYEVNFDEHDGDTNQAVMDLVSQYQIEKKSKKDEKRLSVLKYENQAVPSIQLLAPQPSKLEVSELLQISSHTQAELNRVHLLEFDIFAVRKSTLENELVTVITYILHKEQLFETLGIRLDSFLRFIVKIQQGYKDIAYHNKTHAADLAQTAYFCCSTGEAS